MDKIKTLVFIVMLSGYLPVPQRRLLWSDGLDCHNKKAARGDSCSACNGCLLLDKWKDNKVVTVVSNCIPKNEHGSIKRYNRKEHKVVTVPIPKSIETYNAIMGDLMDQNIACY